ncbi:MAG: penicillin-binding protein [Prolixibacteraceae bacterium]|jgi:cell division protein FtsI (penicillin-binding protein 3)|nr:penicillin-binding protein [Prolixibacteraceae bacterium]
MEIRRDIIMRFGIIYFLIVVLAVIISAGILKIQNLKTDRWKEIAKDIKENTAEIPAARGNICADDGSILATSIPYYEIRLDLKADRIVEVFDKNADQFATEMTNFFGTSKARYLARLKAEFKKGNRWFLIDEKRLDHSELQQFKKLKSINRRIFGSGLIIIPENKRILPHEELASRTIGTLNKGIFGGIHGNIGYTGIEGMQESYLAGENGKALKRNFSGRWINIPLTEPQDGKDIITTLNVNLQDYAQNALMRQMEKSQAKWGTAVVMEVATGDIKAIANIGLRKDGTYGETYNYAFGHAGCSEPGSTFKLMSLMVALEHGYADTSDVFDTGSGVWEVAGQKIYDSDYRHGGHGMISMKRIFELSSNVGTAKIITQFYTGKEKEFIDRIYQFGLNKPLGLGIMGEGVPYIKYPGDKDWWGPSLAWISHGYEIKLTPLQTLTFYNAVANGGKMVKPRFVSEIRENGILQKSFKPEVINPSICSRETLLKAQDMLRGVCKNGTGRSLQGPYYELSGKTGTAVIAYDDEGYLKGGKKNYQASFAGYFPAGNPKYSCIVVIVGPQGAYYGGSVAGPVFREIADKVYATFLEPKDSVLKEPVSAPYVKPGFSDDISLATSDMWLKLDPSATRSELMIVRQDKEKLKLAGIQLPEGIVPNVCGMGAVDALYLLETAGLKVKMQGFGEVIKQSIDSGVPVVRGETIHLDLAVVSNPIIRDSLALVEKMRKDTTLTDKAVVAGQTVQKTSQGNIKKATVATKKPAAIAGNKMKPT